MQDLRLFLFSLILSVLLAPFVVAQPVEVPEPRPGVQIITAADIEQAGVVRLGDLFTLIDDWYASSIDGFAWEVSANGLGAFEQDNWTLLIDGQPVDMRILDAKNINLLPLSPAQIAYVEVINTPTLEQGVMAHGGVLHIHTRQPFDGPAVQGGFAAGNEVGDPGPYRYTAFASPNIDRIGPTLHAVASYRSGASYLRAHIKTDEHHETDTRIIERVRTLYLGEKAPRLLLAGGTVDAGVTGKLGRHHLLASLSRFQNLRFFAPLGLEAPYDHKFTHLGINGDFFPDSRNSISYRLSYTINDLNPRVNNDNLDFNWRQNTLRGNYEVRAGNDAFHGVLGFTADIIQSFTGQPLIDGTLTLPRAYGRIGVTASERIQPELSGYLLRADGEAGLGVLATINLFPAENQTITLSGSAVRQPYSASNPLWLWANRGYAFFQQQGLDVTIPRSFQASSTYTIDASWNLRPSDRLSLTLAGGYRRFDDLTLASYAYTYDPLTTGFETQTTVRGTVFGRVTKGSAEVRFKLTPTLEQRLYYAYLRYPTTDDVFFQAWRNQPWHRVTYSLRYVPLPRLSLFARLQYRSETEWTGFLQAADASDGLYEAQLPDYLLLDFSVQKKLWRDHIDLNLSLRNFLNEPYRLHPAGAITDMVFTARILVNVNR